jgi:transcription initiation factor IIE alpha subunit
MAPLLFTCPNTNQRASTGIQTNVQSLRALWKVMLKVNCPLCGEMHEVSVRETFITGALFDATDRLRELV